MILEWRTKFLTEPQPRNIQASIKSLDSPHWGMEVAPPSDDADLCLPVDRLADVPSIRCPLQL